MSTPLTIALRLLELQKRVAAFDSLYDEEITCLTEELAQLQADFIRHCQVGVPAGLSHMPEKRSARRSGQAAKMRRSSEQPASKSTAQKR